MRSLSRVRLLVDVAHRVHDFHDFLLSGCFQVSSVLVLGVHHPVVLFGQLDLILFGLFFFLHALDTVEFVLLDHFLSTFKLSNFLLFLVILFLCYLVLQLLDLSKLVVP